MVAKKISKTDLIPKYMSPFRKRLQAIILDDHSDYEEKVKRGLPFFLKREIEELKDKYKNGMTWHDIDLELSKKGMMLKKPTFQKYIREKLISRAIDYKIDTKGRMAIYPPDIIEQINFVQYIYKTVDNDKFLTILKILYSCKVSALDLLESKSSVSVYRMITDYVWEADDSLTIYLSESLAGYPDFVKEIVAELNKLREIVDHHCSPIVSKIIDKLESFEVLDLDDGEEQNVTETLEGGENE